MSYFPPFFTNFNFVPHLSIPSPGVENTAQHTLHCFPFFSSSLTFIPFVPSIPLSPLHYLSNHIKIVRFCPFFANFNFVRQLSVRSPGVGNTAKHTLHCFPFFSSSLTFILFIPSISYSPFLHLSNHITIALFLLFFYHIQFSSSSLHSFDLPVWCGVVWKTLPDTSIYYFAFFSSSVQFIPFISSISYSPLLHLSNHITIALFLLFFYQLQFCPSSLHSISRCRKHC